MIDADHATPDVAGAVCAWTLKPRPRQWQVAALERWCATYRGVVAIVTGGGKTMFAMQCMLALLKVRPHCRFVIVVPTIALLDQWHAALSQELGVPERDITAIGGKSRKTDNARIILAVLNSARIAVPMLTQHGEWFLIVDECHRAASEKNRATLKGAFVATLGLSATPERQYDTWFDEFIVPALGPVIFRYRYEEALRDKVISEFDLWNIRVPLTADEEEEIQRVNKAIARELQSLNRQGVLESPRLQRLLLRRSRCSQAAASRIHATVELTDKSRGKRGLIFHEFTASADRIVELLKKQGHRARVYHSGLGPPTRYENLRLYIARQIDVLVTCRALDEGLDVPSTEFGIIAASTTTLRQRVQRLGRILRPAPNKSRAFVMTLYALPSEAENLHLESRRLAEITHTRWFEAVPR